jgi:hypothetical protein
MVSTNGECRVSAEWVQSGCRVGAGIAASVWRTARARLELLAVLAQHQPEGHVFEGHARGGELRLTRRREDLIRGKG